MSSIHAAGSRPWGASRTGRVAVLRRSDSLPVHDFRGLDFLVRPKPFGPTPNPDPAGARKMTFKQTRAIAMTIGAGSAMGWYAWGGGAPATTHQRPKIEKPASPALDDHSTKSPPTAITHDDVYVETVGTTESLQTSAPAEDTAVPPRRALSTEEVVARSEGSVALVRGEKAFGTGFLIRPGILVTNAHVIAQEPVRKLKVTFTSAPPADREAAVKGLLLEDVKRDLAFLAVDSKLPPLDIEAAYRFRRGQEVTVIGNPGTGGGEILENAVSRGVMSTLMTHKNQTFFQMSVSINPGNSGGPVIGSEGRVVGVATLKSMVREGIAGCIPVADLAAALKRVQSQRRSASESAGAIHDIRTAVTPLDELGKEYAKTLDTFARLMDEGTLRGVDPAQIRVAAVRVFRREVGNRLHETTVSAIYPALCRADSNPLLPSDARKPLHDLWQNLLEIQKNSEAPRGTSEDLRNASRTLKSRHDQLVERVNTALDMAGSGNH